MNATDLSRLDGSVVLVCSAQDYRNPPTGIRGTLRVREASASQAPVFQVEMEFPQMFTSRAHGRTVTLDDHEVSQLLASEHYGTFTVTLKDRLDPDGSLGNE